MALLEYLDISLYTLLDESELVAPRSFKKCVPKNFTKFTGKHLYWGHFCNKVGGWRLATLLNRDCGTNVFLLTF